MSDWSFPEGSRLRIDLPTGSVRISPHESPGVSVSMNDDVADQMRVTLHGDVVVIEPASRNLRSSIDVIVRAQPHVSAEARLATASFLASVALGDLNLKSATGDITVGDVDGDVRLKVATSRITMGKVAGSVDVSAASADVYLSQVEGPCRIKTASGDVRITKAAADVDVKTVSGDVEVADCSGRSVHVKTLSGDVTLGIPERRVVDVDLRSTSGQVRSDLERTDGPRTGQLLTSVASVSGSIRLVRAKNSEF
ncbi:MAG: DUF4097 family beta strand repeat protein [Acidimicrobiia bacterium]|nr:DUF4097 family beta strand repeat protein [Acidimicrobiia bacterium]